MKKDVGAKTLLFPAPVLVVGTYDRDGKPNAMTAAWGGICCSTPPCVAISLRKATHTYQNLHDTMAFTISIPSKGHVRQADYFGIASGKNEDKFAATGLTPVKSDFVNAPYIEEFSVNLECKIVQITELGLHTQFVGEVLNAKVDEDMVEGGKSIMEQLAPLLYTSDNRDYYTTGEVVAKAFSVGKDLSK